MEHDDIPTDGSSTDQMAYVVSVLNVVKVMLHAAEYETIGELSHLAILLMRCLHQEAQVCCPVHCSCTHTVTAPTLPACLH